MNPIFQKKISLDELNDAHRQSIHTSLGIVFTAIGTNFIEATMPVDDRSRQPAGILHGGASVVLAESLGSIASRLVVGTQNAQIFGIEVNASHLSSVSEGFVLGRAEPLRIGKTLHVWSISIKELSTGKPTCHARLTTMVRQGPGITTPHPLIF